MGGEGGIAARRLFSRHVRRCVPRDVGGAVWRHRTARYRQGFFY